MAKGGLLLVVESVVVVGLQVDDRVEQVVLRGIVVQGVTCYTCRLLLDWQSPVGLYRARAELHLLTRNWNEIDQVLLRCVP